jgi:hypothetical protein
MEISMSRAVVMLFMLFVLNLPIADKAYTVLGQEDTPALVTVSVEWHNGRPNGSVDVQFGEFDNITIVKGEGKSTGNRFSFDSQASCRIEITIRGAPEPRTGGDGCYGE